MRKWFAGVLALALLGVVQAGWAAELDRRPEVAGALQRLESIQNRPVTVLWDDAQSTPRRVAGFVWQSSEQGHEARARAFLDTFPELIEVEVDALRLEKVEETRTRTVVTFSQYRNELKVLEQRVLVVLDKAGRVISLVSDVRAIGALGASEHRISRADAYDKAFAHLHAGAVEKGPQGPFTRLLVGRALYWTPKGAREVYRVIVPGLLPTLKTECLVDTSTGEILRTRKLSVMR